MATTKQTRNSGSGRSLTRTVVEHSALFSGGLNTEISEIEDATPYTSDELNCAIRANGSRSRRLGIDYEESFSFLPEVSLDVNADYAYASTEWTDVKEGNSQRFIVVQAGPKLYFYRNYGAPFSQDPQEFVLDLTEFALPTYVVRDGVLMESFGDPLAIGRITNEGNIYLHDNSLVGTINATTKKIVKNSNVIGYFKEEHSLDGKITPKGTWNGHVVIYDAVAKEPCRFTQAYGGLFVCSKEVQPFFINALDRPEDSTSSMINNRQFCTISFAPWNDYTWCREYDARVAFSFAGKQAMTSRVVGPTIGNDVSKRYVVIDKTTGKKIGRVPMEEVAHTVNNPPSFSDVQKMSAGALAVLNSFIPGAGVFFASVLGVFGFWKKKKKKHFYTTPLYEYGTDDLGHGASKDPIGCVVLTGNAFYTDNVFDKDGNQIPNARAILSDDFYRTPFEAGWDYFGNPIVGNVTSPGYSWKSGIHKPTTNYYARLWNTYVAPGETLTPREKTGLTAYSVTPWDGDWSNSSRSDKDITVPALDQLIEGEVPTYTTHITDKIGTWEKTTNRQEYMIFVTERGRNINQAEVSITFDTWTDRISDRDRRGYTRKSKFDRFLRYTNKTGLNLLIRDFKGAKDLYAPVKAMPNVLYDLREGPNVAIEPEWTTAEVEAGLANAHIYNLLNQGWGSGVFDKDGGGKSALGSFLEQINYAEDTNHYPANNMYWYVGKDETTLKFTKGTEWDGNRFLEFRPQDVLQYGFGETPAPRGHFVLDYFKQDRSFESGIPGFTFKNGEAALPIEYPRCPYVADIATYAGRIFYLTGDTVLYSQVILEDLSKAGKCYQEADPTAEEISDIVDTDGGMIQIPEIGEGIKLVHVGGVLAVVGTQSTYLISGGSENNFTATAYVGGALQTYSSNAPFSFIEAEGSVFYWSTVGIVQLVPGQGGLTSNVFSNGSIQTFYDNIPDVSKEYCRGFFDNATKELWWLYPSNTDTPRVLDRALICNLKTGAWTPFEFSSDPSKETTRPFIAGCIPLQEAFKVWHRYPLYLEAKGSQVIAKIQEYLIEGSETNETITTIIFNDDSEVFIKDNAVVDEDDNVLYTISGDLLMKGDRIFGYIEGNQVYEVEHQPVAISEESSFVPSGVAQRAFLYSSDGTLEITNQRGWDAWNNLDGYLAGVEYTNRDGAGFAYPFDGTIQGPAAGQIRTIKEHVVYSGSTKVGYLTVAKEPKLALAEDPIEIDRSSYRSAIFLCVDPTQSNATFGVLNNLNYRDWASGDWKGSGYDYESYVVSHPITLDMPYFNKSTPYLLATFRRTEQGFDVTGDRIYPSACQGAVLWDWNVNGDGGKWDAQQELYRYDRDTLFSNRYISTKTRIYGSGRAFQVKLSSVANRAFDIENVGLDVYVDRRI